MTATRHAVHIIAGPTASGKSARALELAQKTNGVIINADSMQIYDELEILTAQPTAEEKKSLPHKLYGVLKPGETCSAGIWRTMAQTEIEKALDENRVPIVVGGTGLYIKALTEGLSPIPETPPEIRAAAIARQEELGNPGFHAELKKRDPVMAARLHPSHTARLVRAWEVVEATGKSLAEWQAQDRLGPPAHWNFEIHKIMPERDELYQRCNDRFIKMLENGALEETATFSKKIESGEIPQDAPLTKALGFRVLRDHLQGKTSLDQAITLAQAETRQYAKRQVTWFRHQL